MTIEQILTILAETPPRIAALTTDLAPAQLHTAPDPDEWSVNGGLAHLRSCSDVWGNYIRVILTQETPTLQAVSPRTWIKKTDYLELAFQSSLQAFTMQRTDLLVVLKSLTPKDWSRSAKVTRAGRVLERTVLFYTQSLALHEQVHLEQISLVANTMRMDQQPPLDQVDR